MISRGRSKGTTRFSIHPAVGTKEAFVAGDFTEWEPRRMRRQSGGEFVLCVPLPPGEHQYKFVIDGEWVTDPDNPCCTVNTYGTSNSVASVEYPADAASARLRIPEPSLAF